MDELVYSTFATQTNEIIRICPVSSSLTFMEDEAKKVIDLPKNYFSISDDFPVGPIRQRETRFF